MSAIGRKQTFGRYPPCVEIGRQIVSAESLIIGGAAGFVVGAV
jgi:hypothetical protein